MKTYSCYFGCQGNEKLHRFPNYLSPRIETTERFQIWKKVLSDELIARGDKYIYQCVRLCELHFPQKYILANSQLTRNSIPVQEPPYLAVDETTTPSLNDNKDVSDQTASDAKNGTEHVENEMQDQNAFEDLEEVFDSLDAEDISAHVCRICLATDCKMYSMKQYNLEQVYLLLTGITSEEYELKMPQTLCFECAQRIQNFTEFSFKSLTAWTILVKLIEKDMLTMDNIKSVDRAKNFLTSKLTLTNITHDYFDIQVKEEEIEVDQYNDYEYISNEDLMNSENYEHDVINDGTEVNVISEQCEIIDGDDMIVEYSDENTYRTQNGHPCKNSHPSKNRHPIEKLHPTENGHTSKNIHPSENFHPEITDPNVNFYSTENRRSNENLHSSENGHPHKKKYLSGIKKQIPLGLHSTRKKKKNKKPLFCHDMFIGKNIAPEDHEMENIKDVHNIQSKTKRYACEVCDMQFDTDSDKNQHVWLRHLGVQACKRPDRSSQYGHEDGSLIQSCS